MTRIHKWSRFEEEARGIFAKSPNNTRYSMKQRTKTTEDEDGKIRKKVCVILRVTDDVKTVTFETTERHSIKRISSLMKWFCVKMVSVGEDELKEESSIKARLRE